MGQRDLGHSMARPNKKTEGPHIFWRNGRAYADLRAYADVGGKKEALATQGSAWGTKDPDIALVLFEGRLADLQAKRKGQAGATQLKTTTLVELVRYFVEVSRFQVQKEMGSPIFRTARPADTASAASKGQRVNPKTWGNS